MKLKAGDVLSGTLRLVRLIADGGMGSVWIAEHLVLGTEVAVKVMSGQWADLPSARSRFLREARMTAKIDSPHVVSVLDCRHDAGDEPYIVLELLHGEDLEQRVRRHGPLSIFEVVEIVAQTCEALTATHAAGIVHRDIKPENVFLVRCPTTFVKLLDFGISKPMNAKDCDEIDGFPAGTAQYMSPEQTLDPAAADGRSDLFGLAAVAFFALTGRRPFEAQRPSDVRPEVPVVLDRWFERALAHDAKHRFANARQMANALFDAVRDSRTSSVATMPPPAMDAGVDASELPMASKIAEPVAAEAAVAAPRWRIGGGLAQKVMIAVVAVAFAGGAFASPAIVPVGEEENASTITDVVGMPDQTIN